MVPRDAGCPLIEVLRVEVQGIQAAILKDLQAARDMVVERKAAVEAEDRWEKRIMPFLRPALIALFGAILTLISDRTDHFKNDRHKPQIAASSTFLLPKDREPR